MHPEIPLGTLPAQPPNAGVSAGPMPPWPWLNTTLHSAVRARLLADAMTPAELAGQLVNADANASAPGLPADDVGSLLNAHGERLTMLATAVRNRHRLKVPVLFALDAVHGHAMSKHLGTTVFPSPLALAASFDTAVAQRVAEVTSEEMIATGIRWTYAPNIDVARDLRFGRIEETFGEDPYLVGEMGAAMVRGLQGPDATRPRVLATAKHLTGYTEGVGARDAAECAVSWRVLTRDHLPPVRRVVQAGVRAVMSGYHAIDGVPCVLNRRLLRDELRQRLGFTGFVVSDADNVQWCSLLMSLEGSHADFIVRAVEAGNEVHLAATGVVDALVAAVASGRLPLHLLRDAAALFLEAKFALGLFDHEGDSGSQQPAPQSQLRTPASLADAVDAAAASMVLLENRGVLPLPQNGAAGARLTQPQTQTQPQPQRIALIGRLADDVRAQLGCWTILCRNEDAAAEIARHADAASWTYRDALTRRAEQAGALLRYAPGCGPVPGVTAGDEDAAIADAVAAAQDSDLVIAIVGDSDHWAGEGRDRADLNLPGQQQRLLQALHATGRPLVVVLAVTKPLALPWVQEHAAAVVCTWSAGMGGGPALAALLWGDRDFTGRTPATWPAHVGQMPMNYDRVGGIHFEGFSGGPLNSVPTASEEASSDVHLWRQVHTRHIDLPARWVHGLWPFGHGLSYAEIDWVAATMTQPTWRVGESPRVRVELRNPGPRDGSAVVQVYVRDVVASVTRPDRRLAGWARVAVPAGGSASAEITIAPEVLELVDASGQRVTEPGTFHALVGLSSLVTALRVLPFEVVSEAGHTALMSPVAHTIPAR